MHIYSIVQRVIDAWRTRRNLPVIGQEIEPGPYITSTQREARRLEIIAKHAREAGHA
jgi:hypothetical protein